MLCDFVMLIVLPGNLGVNNRMEVHSIVKCVAEMHTGCMKWVTF